MADQALLVALEGIAAVDVADLQLGIGHHASAANLRKQRTEAAVASEAFPSSSTGADEDTATCSYSEALVTLLPAMSQLCSHADGDVRVVLASSLRRLLPGTLKSLNIVSPFSAFANSRIS